MLTREIRYGHGEEAVRTEYFLPGTEQALIIAVEPSALPPAIRYPTPCMVVALDPDIPSARQRILLLSQGMAQPRWRLDGKLLPASQGRHDWAPWPGRHRLELLDAGNQVLDRVEFEVRGALAKISLKK